MPHRVGGFAQRVRLVGASMSSRASAYSAKGAVAGAEHFVARLELRHVLADRLDDTGDVNAPNMSSPVGP